MGQRGPKTILFLCTGNYYRSRFAEILFNSVATRMGLPWQATSCGLALERGVNNIGPMAVSALEDLTKRGLRVPTRMPVQATAKDFEQADWVVALKEDEHLPLLRERFPDWGSKVEFWHVDDVPDIFPLIEREVMDLAARLIMGGKARTLGPLPELKVVAPPKQEPPKKTSTVRVGRETKGRRGKGVTIIFDLPLDAEARAVDQGPRV